MESSFIGLASGSSWQQSTVQIIVTSGHSERLIVLLVLPCSCTTSCQGSTSKRSWRLLRIKCKTTSSLQGSLLGGMGGAGGLEFQYDGTIHTQLGQLFGWVHEYMNKQIQLPRMDVCPQKTMALWQWVPQSVLLIVRDSVADRAGGREGFYIRNHP